MKAKLLQSESVVVSFLHLPAYIADEEIEDRLRALNIELISPIYRRFYKGYPYGQEPRFVPTVTNVTVREGEMAILPCSIHSLGTKQVAWRRTNEDHFITVGATTWIKDSTHSIDYKTLANDVTSWNLIIKNVRRKDAGQYECQITSTNDYNWHVQLNVVGKKQLSYTPTGENVICYFLLSPPVGKPAIFVSGRKYVDQGEPIRLVCNATGGRHTPEDIDWFKNGDKIGRSKYHNIIVTKYRSMATKALISELIIDHSQTSDTGNYICRSSREDIASIRVTVFTADSTSNVKRSDIKLGKLGGKTSVPSSSSRVCCTGITFLNILVISILFSAQLLSVIETPLVLCLSVMKLVSFALNLVTDACAQTLVSLLSGSSMLVIATLHYGWNKRVLYPLCHTSGCG
ncbi:uncharacterized protein LOC121388301 [Gigantopelta aegis]|uniref:uncharacterized protein LOC121388301 n=1 Tax=Gigantopelta aegis TaxID=1735272 RepID=UPI001B88A17C|nr:uncharacterized protein LOC121388301 [Gigantopelta aegis]